MPFTIGDTVNLNLSWHHGYRLIEKWIKIVIEKWIKIVMGAVSYGVRISKLASFGNPDEVESLYSGAKRKVGGCKNPVDGERVPSSSGGKGEGDVMSGFKSNQ